MAECRKEERTEGRRGGGRRKETGIRKKSMTKQAAEQDGRREQPENARLIKRCEECVVMVWCIK